MSGQWIELFPFHLNLQRISLTVCRLYEQNKVRLTEKPPCKKNYYSQLFMLCRPLLERCSVSEPESLLNTQQSAPHYQTLAPWSHLHYQVIQYNQSRLAVANDWHWVLHLCSLRLGHRTMVKNWNIAFFTLCYLWHVDISQLPWSCVQKEKNHSSFKTNEGRC